MAGQGRRLDVQVLLGECVGIFRWHIMKNKHLVVGIVGGRLCLAAVGTGHNVLAMDGVLIVGFHSIKSIPHTD